MSGIGRRVEIAAVVYAALLATAGFAWQVWQWQQERPIVRIDAPTQLTLMNVDGEYLPVRTALRFVNESARTVTVYEVQTMLWFDFGRWGARVNWTTTSRTDLPIRIDGGSIARWEKTEHVAFDRLPSLAREETWDATLSVRLSTTLGPIIQSFPVTVVHGLHARPSEQTK